MIDLQKRARYYALIGIAAELLRQKLLTLGEYYQVLSALSQKYLGSGQS